MKRYDYRARYEETMVAAQEWKRRALDAESALAEQDSKWERYYGEEHQRRHSAEDEIDRLRAALAAARQVDEAARELVDLLYGGQHGWCYEGWDDEADEAWGKLLAALNAEAGR